MARGMVEELHQALHVARRPRESVKGFIPRGSLVFFTLFFFSCYLLFVRVTRAVLLYPMRVNGTPV